MPAGKRAVVRKIRPIAGLVFDCDGVLFDTRDVNRFYYNHILEELGLAPMTAEEEEYAFMHTVDAALARLVPEELMPRASEILGHMTYDDFMDRMVPEPGLRELLEFLQERNVRMAVNTNRKNSMEKVLERFEMTDFFFPVMTAAKVSRPKPDPEGLLHIVQTWGISPERMAYLGDSILDQEAAQRGGVPLWAYKSRGLEAELHVDSFHELRHWLETACA
jgi:HAD superfamily hydrolase (TIGR01549 family)